ncbi:MAG: polyprenyl diphosphate synthase [Candidatus Pacebacteria bacterium]|jgi:undecaprenyl diphosphate synthase|nr:di-trans,poly-cis-decaprenylcistransferase [bacterium]MDP6528007.1 polyprenyl diphosphate synthase [Candidatus Paceibacterota bacterium]MDP6659735.1 polyprenyl diphosphate synthase [Candidatus Paceibacterota bacterium]|tara:strand:- start:3557 stop:4228 length:672 start_codon:yes stop_codon:yes gene_type:complete
MNPKSIGIIMDGNRRWARERGLPTFEGHRRGANKLKEVIGWNKDSGIPHLIVYALSTENRNRSKEEVSYLMDLFRTFIKNELKEIKKEKIRILFPGERSMFPEDLQELMNRTEEETGKNEKYTLSTALSYGGRAEIVNVANKLVKKGKEVTENDIQNELWTKEIPDPDIIIRTGGEHRLSGFLTWQSVYSELFFVDTYWPAFSREEFDSILEEYKERERRHGK